MNNICVCTWYDTNIKEYADYCALNNETYCKKHKIDFIKDNTRRLDKVRTMYFERYPLILELFNKYHYNYVIWIDADAFFYFDAPNIVNLINFHKDKDIIFSEDNDVGEWGINDIDIENNHPLINVSDACKVNSGVLIVKNTEYSKFIIENIVYNIEWARKGVAYFWEDQGPIRWLLHENVYNINSKTVIIPYSILQHFADKTSNDINIETYEYKKQYGLENNPFIYHMAGADYDVRCVGSKLYYYKYCFLCI